jgi:hypothetical protein
MQRPIEFRGLRVDGLGFVYGQLVYTGKMAFIITKPDMFDYTGGDSDYYEDLSFNHWHEVLPSSIGQFTGLVDKNGVKMFEGDRDKSGDVIMYDEKLCLFALHFYQEFYDRWAVSTYPIHAERIEITGNIHEDGK